MPRKDYALKRLLDDNPIIDTRRRKGDRHKDRNRKHSGPSSPSKWERRSIVAWDGEGANLDDGTHVYNLLANSRGDYIIDHAGLGTIQVFEFMLSHSSSNDINVIFGGSYDVNMILRDVPRDYLLTLWKTGTVYWRQYRIVWANRKRFSISLMKDSKPIKSFVLWDVLGYFQSTFVKACRLWLGELTLLNEIEDMKSKRSVFKSEDIESIIAYNRRECELLVQLTLHLFRALDEANIKLSRYDGAGSIAAALLRANGIVEHKGVVPEDVNRMAQYAYSGGRIEAVKMGTTPRRVSIYRYDINSAYPSAALTLPSYKGATWKQESWWDGTYNSLVAITFHFDKEAAFYPLWYRDEHGAISYPRNGRGIYWGVEVENLFKYYEEGIDFEVEWAMNCTLANDTKPFEFIREQYAQRRVFADRGSMASEALKLGLNSIYGKLVQQAGYRGGRIPTYHQLLWGGQITAYTRAKLFDAAMQHPKDVIAFATDAVFTTRLLDLSCSKSLGEWSFDKFHGITMVQAGVYWLREDNETWAEKYRGFDKGSLNPEGIIDAWRNGTEYEAKLTRFVGIGSALMSSEFSIWRSWQTSTRKLDIQPTGKRIRGSKTDYHSGLRVTRPTPNITPDTISMPYPIIWIDGHRLADNQTVDGVPVEVLIDEEEDGGL